MDTRSVFSNVCAEVTGEGFILSPEIKTHLQAFTGRDKPLYKLCQSASYIQTSLRWLKSCGIDNKPFNTRALSITQNGFESLCARFFTKNGIDPRTALIENLGRAYRDMDKAADKDEEDLNDYIRQAFDRIRKALPNSLSKKLLAMHKLPRTGANINFDLSEEVTGFFNPMDLVDINEAMSWVETDDAIQSFLKSDPKKAIYEVISQQLSPDKKISLRDLHAGAVIAGMRTSIKGELSVLGLEGNPGIGKTTAVITHLKESDNGFLFIYVSPRVIINDDVTENLARDKSNKELSGILTITTNSKLIQAAREKGNKQEQSNKKIDSAVVVDGVKNLHHPDSSTLILTPTEKEELELIHVGVNNRKRRVTEREDRMENANQQGVLKVLSTTTRTLLDCNPNVNKVVITAAIQGYREMDGGKNTLSALDKLFKSPTNHQAGKQERIEFSKRISTIVVMVDELTGDGAGALIVNSLAKWLKQQFIKPFTQTEPLFKVILIISDASLGNEVVMDRYLNSGKRAPDKVLVSQSAGNRAFRLAVTPVRVGGKKHNVLHIMTNSYPASKLYIDYRIKLDRIKIKALDDGKIQTSRQAISEQQGEAVLNNAIREIKYALDKGADQIIFFAQDKIFLRTMETLLVVGNEETPPILNKRQVAILDSSVIASKRKRLISNDYRDTVKVFLMTSSGARGISFPKTDWIIALIPRFNIEAALMEIAQLIYRGRGRTYTTDGGKTKEDGDWKDRHLVMLLQDFLAEDDAIELRQWLRQVSDLLTYLVMLRATIYTRIMGDGGLDKQNLALVPVGGIESVEMRSLMSTHVKEFLQESNVFLRDYKVSSKSASGLIANAQKNTRDIFSKFQLEGTAKTNTFKSFVSRIDMQKFSQCASADNSPLLMLSKNDPHCLLPKEIYCVGPFWLEHWNNHNKQERFSIEGWSTNISQKIPKLFGELKYIHSDKSLPFKLRQSAEELYLILARDKVGSTREFSTVKELKSSATWIILPIDYLQFLNNNGRSLSLGDNEEAWRDSLGSCIKTNGEILPVIPRYADIPYAAVIGEQDPARLKLIFDNRYLAASNELNLLNTLLLK